MLKAICLLSAALLFGGCGATAPCFNEDPACPNYNASGCADDSREAFADVATYPTLAGCAATWTEGFSGGGTQNAGSDDGRLAASACAQGWHPCTFGEVTQAATAEACASQPGAFAVQGLNHTGCPRVTCDHPPCHGIICVECGEDPIPTGYPSLRFAACGTDAQTCSAETFDVCQADFPCGPDEAFTDNGINTDPGEDGHFRGVLCCLNPVP